MLYSKTNLIEELKVMTRVCFFVNKKIAVTKWIFTQHSLNLVTLHLKFKTSDDLKTWRINVHNVYNSESNMNIKDMHILVKLNDALRVNEKHIVMKDFNLHHSLWVNEDYHHQHAKMNEMIEIMKQHSLQLILLLSMIMYRARFVKITLNLIFVSQNLKNSQIACNVANDMNNDSNHLSMRTVLNLSVTSKEIKQTRIWNKMNEKLLLRILRLKLLILHTSEFKDEIDYIAILISIALQKVIEVAVSLSREFSRSMFEWINECKKIQMKCRRLKQRH